MNEQLPAEATVTKGGKNANKCDVRFVYDRHSRFFLYVLYKLKCEDAKFSSDDRDSRDVVAIDPGVASIYPYALCVM